MNWQLECKNKQEVMKAGVGGSFFLHFLRLNAAGGAGRCPSLSYGFPLKTLKTWLACGRAVISSVSGVISQQFK